MIRYGFVMKFSSAQPIRRVGKQDLPIAKTPDGDPALRKVMNLSWLACQTDAIANLANRLGQV